MLTRLGKIGHMLDPYENGVFATHVGNRERLKVAFLCEASLQMSISNDFEAHREILRADFQNREVEGSEK